MKIANFEDGLAALVRTNDFTTLRMLIVEVLNSANPYQARTAKDRIARIMRAKQAAEVAEARGYPQALDAVDKKYKELAMTLKFTQTGVVQPRVVGPNPQLFSPPPQVSVAPTAKNVALDANEAAKLAKSAQPLDGLGSFGTLAILNWIKSKRALIMKGAGVGAVLGGAYWAYQKMTGDNDKPAKNPKDNESEFTRTIKSIEKYRAFSRMTKDPDFAGDYSALLEGKFPKKRPTASKMPTPDKLSQWEADERQLMNTIDSTHYALGVRPKTEAPKLPFEPKYVENPIPIVSDQVNSTKQEEDIKPKRKKKNPVPASNDFEEDAKPTKPTVTKVNSNEPAGRLIPIIKRTKRIRKIG